MAYDDVEHLLCCRKFLLHAESIRIRTYVDASGRHVPVLRGDDAGDTGNRKAVCLKFVRVAIYLDLTLRSTGDGYCTHA